MSYLQKEAGNHSIYAFDKDTSIQLAKSITQVKTEKEFKQFYDLSSTIYADDPNWVKPFWNEFNLFFQQKNPFWDHAKAALFILYKNNEPVGRIAAIIDDLYVKINHENIGFFGFFECENNYEYAETLLQTAQNWLAMKGSSLMQGPIDGRIDNGCGFLYQGFDSPPTLLSTYTKPYYINFAEQFNMRKTRDQYTYLIDLTHPLPQTLQKKAEICLQSGVKTRHFNLFRTNKELDWWIDFFLETFQDHWGYIPVSKKEVKSRFGIKQMRWIVDSHLFFIAEYNEKPVAYIWSTPDYNQLFKTMNGNFGFFQILRFLLKRKQIKTGKLHLIGIKKDARHQYLGSLLNYKTLVEMKKRGYQQAEVGWIDERNGVAHKTIALTGAKLTKRSRVFEKPITP